MSFFDPKIYNKQNLKEKDRKELDYWESEFKVIINGAVDTTDFDEGTYGKMKKEIVDAFCEELKMHLGLELQNIVVSLIDNYPEGTTIMEFDDPDTYDYEPEGD